MKRYTWKPDVPDQRDHLFAPTAQTLPASIDLRTTCPPVVDQGQLGSCTANALAGALGYIHPTSKAFSRLFIYYNERAIEGTIRQDAGAMIRDGIKTLAAQGACEETLWPYLVAKFKTKPKKAAYATTSAISAYQRIVTVDDMLQCLAAGYPFVFGFTVYESFESAEVARTGVAPMPAMSEKVLGGHAVMAVGYNLAEQTMLVRNSWGTGWGQQGYFTLPFAYFQTRGLTDDFWTIRK